MPASIVKSNNKLLLYYTGWNRNLSTSYKLSIGIAISHNNGLTFERLFNGPILDRNMHDPIWVAQPYVIKEKNIWKMWYLSACDIKMINDHPEPFYNVKYAESKNGINWERKNIICIGINPEKDLHAIGRPFVFKEDGIYKMFHSNRSAIDYRIDSKRSYRLCYSESINGLDWEKKPFYLNKKGIPWVKEMDTYASFYKYKNQKKLILNGNGFGKSGFGYAHN